jgi:hypothetical protein
MEGEYVMDTICDTKKSKTPRTTYVGVFLFFAGLASWFFGSISKLSTTSAVVVSNN